MAVLSEELSEKHILLELGAFAKRLDLGRLGLAPSDR